MSVDRFYSQELAYSYNRKILTSDKPVRIYKGKNIVVSGEKMWTNTKSNRTKVTGNVKIVIYNLYMPVKTRNFFTNFFL